MNNSLTFLQSIINGVADPIFVKDDQHRWIFLNDAFCQWIGWQREQLIGKSDYDFLPKAEADLSWEKDRQVLETGIENENEETLTQLSGETRIISTKRSRFEDESGNKFLVGTMRDITERKRIKAIIRATAQPEKLISAITLLPKQLANHVAIAIQQSQLYEEALHKQEQSQALNRVSQAIRSSLDLDKIFATATKEIGQLLKVEHTDIWQYVSSQRTWINLSHYQLNSDTWQKLDFQIPNDISSQLQQLEIVCIEDTNTLENPIDVEIAQMLPGAWLIVPLQVQQKIWGSLALRTAGYPHHWRSTEIELVSHIADQLTIAIQQSQQRERERLLNHLSQVIHNSLDLETIFSTATKEIAEILQVDSVDIVQYLPKRKLWIVVASHRQNLHIKDRLHFEFADENNEISAQMKQHQVVRLDDTRFLLGTDSANQDVALQYPGAWLCVPLRHQDRVWGNLALRMEGQPYCWHDLDVELVVAIADQLAMAIQQSQLLQQSQQQREREGLLNRVTQAIRSSLDLQTIFITAATEVGNLLNVDNTDIVQYIPERKVWVNVIRYNRDLGTVRDFQLEISDEDNLLAEKLKRLEIVRVDSSTNLSDVVNMQLAERFPGAWLLVPLQFQGSVWGSLTLSMDKQVYYWQDLEVELVAAIADQLAIAISQSNLLERETLQRQELFSQNLILEQLYKQAEAATNTKNLFLAYTSHEIRTPISGVIGMTELLADTELTASQQEFVRTIKVCGKNLLHIINKILDLAKLEAKQLDLENVDFDLVDCIEEVGDIVSLQAHEKNLEIYILIDHNVPRQLRGDQGRLQQVLTNLTSNAIKFTNTGHVIITATLISQTDGTANLKFIVKDTGIGISIEDKQKLFQPFSQLSTSNRQKQMGSGLGLIICKQLVELMKGEIGFDPNPEGGSSFWFTVEFAKSQSASSDVSATATFFADCQALSSLKLLIVSEYQTTRQTIKHYVNHWGLQPDEADGGLTAMKTLHEAVAKGNPYDLVILDMQMSVISGELLGHGIKLDPQLSQTQIAIATFINQHDIAERLVSQGFTAQLIKPIKVSHLQEVLLKVSQIKANQAEATPLIEIPVTQTLQLEIPTPIEVISEKIQAEVIPAQLELSPELEVEREKLPAKITMPTVTNLAVTDLASSINILIVEDNPINQTLTIMQLKNLGYQADCANHGREALDMLLQKSYKVILMDCQMPILDGYSTTREIRRLEAEAAESGCIPPPHITIIAMTASVLDQDKQACFEAGMDDYLSKPILREYLMNMLNRWLPKANQ